MNFYSNLDYFNLPLLSITSFYSVHKTFVYSATFIIQRYN